MQPQEQPVPQQQPVYYVPMQPAPAPQAEKPRWVEDLESRTSGHSAALALIGLMLLANLILTFVLWQEISSALHPFG
jgi:hypothetical protein